MTVDPNKVRDLIETFMRSKGLSVEDAAREAAGLLEDQAAVEGAVAEIREAGRRNQTLKVPGGVESLEYRKVLGEVRTAAWFSGVRDHDRHWPSFRGLMVEDPDFPDAAVDSIDEASTKVVSYLSDPGIHKLSKKGLVIGYVQSGKTANYSSVIAKAADAGYRLFIVLSGIHNGLRSQTQGRLIRDLYDSYPDPWALLTTEEGDFGQVTEGAGLLSARELRNLIVVKKNASRLKRLCDWLEKIHPNVRERCPALIIDDEADQATPNSKAGLNQMSKINELTRRLFELLPTASYVAYTATPFANVFMDPAADDELYPADFILDLPRPDGYFGAEQLFGRQALDDADDPVEGHDMIREIPTQDAASLRPPRGAQAREAFSPPIPPSLDQAFRWFVLCVAARTARGQADKHSSMLVHGSHYIATHFTLAANLRKHHAELKTMKHEDLRGELETLWDSESPRVSASEFGNATTEFDEIWLHVPKVLDDIQVIVDNGASDARLNYKGGTKTVVAVGGNTLSRGLTLEGLSVSYFVRTANAYDTLLQMGRWFGFRRGYEDLPRIWMTDDLVDRFRFLAAVEEEIRQDIHEYEREGIEPRQLGVRIRQHPAMAITAASKMHHVHELKIGYAGRRMQTRKFKIDQSDKKWLDDNVAAGKRLLDEAQAAGCPVKQVTAGKWVIRDVPKLLISDFLASYSVHEDHRQLDPQLTVAYLDQRDDERAETWNVAVIGSSQSTHTVGGEPIDLGTVDLGLPEDVPRMNRAPLKGRRDPVDIKSLMSRPDRLIDLELASEDRAQLSDESDFQRLRVERADGRGLLLLYPISPDSVPMGAALKAKSRQTMKAAGDILGMGIVFPEASASDGGIGEEHTYVGLPAEVLEGIDEESSDDEQLLGADDESDSNIDGDELLNRVSD